MDALKSGTVLFFATLSGGVFNFFFQVFMGRTLSVEDFGSMNALFSVILITGIPAAAMVTALSKKISSLNAGGRRAEAGRLYRVSFIRMAVYGGVVLCVSALLKRPITRAFGLGSEWVPVIAGAGLLFAFILAANLGVLQGLRRYRYFGAGIGLLSPLKLLFGGALAAAGFGIAGAVAGLSCAILAVFVLTTMPLLRLLSSGNDARKPAARAPWSGFHDLVYAAAFAFMTNIDLIMVKLYFPAREAGLYAAASVLGKAILYASSFSSESFFGGAFHRGRHALKLLDRGLFRTFAVFIIAAPVLVLFPGHLLGLLFGPAFYEAAPVLRYYAVAAGFMSMAGLFTAYSASRRNAGFLFKLVTASALLPLAITVLPQSLTAVALAAGTAAFALSLAGLAGAIRERRSVSGVQAKLEGIAGR
ncbi:MAG: hypothetical protein H3C68_07120 [Deltaproteobacteria bacterium]|nr:hypothetical protein [Deltaproteobacteria bacterium]MBZ0219474.1 hypothetical protein [Deltaproteobacteria bacterium]